MNLFIKPNKIYFIYIANLILTGSLFYYIHQSFSILPKQVPFFYSMPWGNGILADKIYLYGIIAFIFIATNIYLYLSLKEFKNSNHNLVQTYMYAITIFNIIAIAFTQRIINLVSLYPISVPPLFKIIVFPAIFAFIATAIITPFVIKIAKTFNFIDDPLSHVHPAMLITKPVPRAGGLAFIIGILIPALFLLPIFTSQKLIGIFVGAIICVVTGLFDDKKDLSPYTRLLLQALAILITVLSGIILIYIPNPFGQAIKLDDFRIVFNLFGEHKVFLFSVIAACIWMGWVMNFMSWANGTDGVYAGLVSISAATIAILMFWNLSADRDILYFIVLASLVLGGALAMTIFTWPPMKIMWGFGATAPALIIAALSILGSTKVATTLIVLMIPFLDAIFAVIRRLSRGQLPVWGDREHLHHKLLDIGWSKKQIALFYWGTTLILATIGLATSGKIKALSLITIAIIVIFGFTSLNIITIKRGKKTLSTAKIPH